MKSEIEKYIKAVRQEILNNGMEIVPVSIMFDSNSKILLDGYLLGKNPHKTAKLILSQYV